MLLQDLPQGHTYRGLIIRQENPRLAGFAASRVLMLFQDVI